MRFARSTLSLLMCSLSLMGSSLAMAENSSMGTSGVPTDGLASTINLSFSTDLGETHVMVNLTVQDVGDLPQVLRSPAFGPFLEVHVIDLQARRELKVLPNADARSTNKHDQTSDVFLNPGQSWSKTFDLSQFVDVRPGH